MATTPGTLHVPVKADTSGFSTDLRRQMGSLASGIGKTFAAIGAAATAGLVAIGTSAIKAAAEAEKVAAQTAAVIESTGGAANVTAGQVANLASEIAAYSGISDEAVQAGENMLLTFTNVQNRVGEGNDIFNQATRILADMSTALGTDMSQQAVQLGKALNDPIAGISALSRVGVTFTEDQKEVIASLVETGDVAGAQKVILEELAKEFGGSAAALGATTAGQFSILKETVGNALEDIGGSMLEVANAGLPVLTGAFTDLIGSVGPGLESLFSGLSQTLASVLPTVGPVLSQIGEAVGEVLTALGPALGQVIEALAPVIGEVATSLGDLLVALVPLIPPLGELLAAIAPLIPLLVDLIVTVLKPIIPALTEVIEWVAKVVDAFVTWVEESEILKTIGDIIAGVVETAVGIVKGFVGFIGDAWRSIREVTSTVWGAISGFLGDVWGGIKEAAHTIWAAIKAGIVDPIKAVFDVLREIWSRIRDAAITAWKAIDNTVGAVIRSIIRGIQQLIEWVQRAIDWLARLKPGFDFGDIAENFPPPTPPSSDLGASASVAGVFAPATAVMGEDGVRLLATGRAGAELGASAPVGQTTINVSVNVAGSIIGSRPDDIAEALAPHMERALSRTQDRNGRLLFERS
jgi:phage-related protein